MSIITQPETARRHPAMFKMWLDPTVLQHLMAASSSRWRASVGPPWWSCHPVPWQCLRSRGRRPSQL